MGDARNATVTIFQIHEQDKSLTKLQTVVSLKIDPYTQRVKSECNTNGKLSLPQH